MKEATEQESSTEIAGPNERIVMCRCGVNPATEPHSCPYADEIGDNDDPEYCTCCDDCMHECAMDI